MRPEAFSSSFRLRLERPISQVPSDTALMPEPEPVGLYVYEVPGLLLVKYSPREPMTFSMEVEPSNDTLPSSAAASGALAEQPAKSASTQAAAITMLMIFFIFFDSFLFRFFIVYGYYVKSTV